MMTTMTSSVMLAVYVLFAAGPADARYETLSTVIYTNHGDRVPSLSNEYQRLTPLGAQQLYNAGGNMRKRYIAPDPNSTELESPTWQLPPALLDGDFVTILTTREPYNLASAQAFMQGLYPPLASNGTPTYIDTSFLDANNNVVTGPLNGMQFPPVWTVSEPDIDFMYLKGTTDCTAFKNRIAEYVNSAQYKALDEGSSALYNKLNSQFLSQIYPPGSAPSYSEAWQIYDYLNYQSIHNQTVAELLDPADLAEAQLYASDWTFALYANTSESGTVGSDTLDAIAGRTLAALVVNLFSDTVISQGSTNKVNLLFGNHIGMVSFAALADLMVPQHSQFYNVPAPGSSFIFELFANVPENSTEYPYSADMFVHFYYTNGTDEYATTIEYPLFGASPSQAVMSLSDFTHSMSNIMIQNSTQWCNACQSSSQFCLTDAARNSAKSSSSHGVSPAVAGVIGALVALVFAVLVLTCAMLLGGVRMHRVQTKRRSELGGFKGAEKLASDQDLTLPKGGAGAVVIDNGTQDARGHERVGSWELRNQANNKDIGFDPHSPSIGGTIMKRSSFEDDEIHVNPFSNPIHPRDSV